MATSIDGLVATTDGDSDWVSEVDAASFEKEITQKGCIVVGSKTFYQFLHDLYPVDGVTNIVLSKTKTSDDDMPENVCFAATPERALEVAAAKGHEQILLIGGGTTNAAFLKKKLIDEIIISVHPLILGQGIHLFEKFKEQVDLEQISSENLEEGLVKIVYKVIK